MLDNSKAQVTALVDEGLKDYMLKVYNFMAGGLAVTALAAYILMSSPTFMRIFFHLTRPAMQPVCPHSAG